VGTSGLAAIAKTVLITIFGQFHRMLTDPWKPYEIYVVVLFFYLLKPVLWKSYEIVQSMRGLAHKISDENFQESFFGFLYFPAYIHGLGMAFNWLMDTIVFVFDAVGITEHKVLSLISGSDTAVYIVGAGVFLYKLQDYYLDEFLDLVVGKNKVDTGVQDLIHRMLELIVVLSTFGLASYSVGVSKELITGLYSLLGIGFGFASQEVLQNFFGGLMLVAMQPFTVGDNIRFTHPGGEAELEGQVLRVGYYQTTLLVEDGSTLSVPNQWFVTVDVTNKDRKLEMFEGQMRKSQKRALEENAA